MPDDLRLHDTYAGELRDFVPADPSRVTVYCCGPTVYAAPHIGNMRAAVVADTAVRLLRHAYGEGAVIYARNLTDIDDKIIARAREAGAPIGDVTEAATRDYHAATDALGCLRPNAEPRATEHIGAMQSLITELLARGHAYARAGHVLFAVETFDRYGALSRLDRDAILAGARVEVAPYKRDPADFVLWKPSGEDEPGWDAPSGWGVAGRGRPGWHLECSAMIEAVLGAPIDLHLGGQDLRFPHHENEIAQSCCGGSLGDVPLARFWLHNGMLRLHGGKMAKSKGNILTVPEMLEAHPGEALRLALLSAHYRQPLDWSEDLLASAKTQLDRLYRAVPEDEDAEAEPPAAVVAALNDDLNTPAAIAALHAARDAAGGSSEAAASLRAGGRLLGLLSASPASWFQGAVGDGDRIDALLAERAAARKARDFARADAIRDQLAGEGIVLEDGPDGATWRRA